MSLLPPYKPTTWKLIILGSALVLLAIIIWAYSGGKPKDETPLIVNQGIDQGKNAIVGNLIANEEKVVVNAEINANKANANLANSVQRDSNVFSGNGFDADDAFCSRFPKDSSCADWRKRHGL